MDIWDWVERSVEDARKAGRHRLAELILRVPQWATNDDHAQLDAVMPEALALAREAKSPWLEVYFRHWNLQSRVLHRLEVTEWMSEAARLLDYAHSDAAKGCPQSVCVTQDFASCFGHLDGPGYVEERLAAARETLSRIDATWPCFTCISTECAAALADGERLEESLAFLDKQEAALLSAGLGRLRQRFLGSRVDTLLELGRPREALELLEAAGDPADENERLERQIHQARALGLLGQLDEAREVLPTPDMMKPALNLYRLWAEAAGLLAAKGARPNDWLLERTLLEMEDALSKNGAVRKAFGIARERAWLALLRRARTTALHACARMEALLPRLRRPLGADVDVARTRAEALALPRPQPPLPDSPDALLDEEREGGPEEALDAYRAARERWPGHEGLVQAEASALEALGRAAEAEEVLRAHLAREPGALYVLRRLLGLYLQRRRLDALRALAGDLLGQGGPVGAQATARWYLAQAALAEQKPDEAKTHLRALVELDPDSLPATLRLASLEREGGELEAALARLNVAVARWPEPGPHDWERMVVATLMDRWEAVRDSAARLGLPVPGESGPVYDEDGPLCRVRFIEENGELSDLFAEQTGPVTARVLSIALPGYPQHTGDEVVFTMPPLNPPPAPEDQGRHTWLYPVVAVKRPGHQYVFELEGVHPGPEPLEALRTALRGVDARVSVRSDDRYWVSSPLPEEQVDGLELKGLYALVAVPPEVSLAGVDAVLRDVTAGWKYPLVWRGLLEKLGREEELARHRELAEKYNLEG